jgi:hypothetical protein
MKTKAQHTPTPWNVVYGFDLWVSSPKTNQFVAEVVYDEDKPQSVEELEANAEFIVRACNNHDDLVGTLSECADLLEQAKKYSDKSGDVGMAAFYASGAEQARKLLKKINR